MIEDADLQQMHQRATRRGAGVDCPPEETLMRAARKSLPRREQDQLVAHLGRCSDCARDFRIAKSLAPWANEASQARDAERAASPLAIAVGVAFAVSIPLIAWMFLSRTAASRTIDQLYAEIAKRDQEIRLLRSERLVLRSTVEQPHASATMPLDAAKTATIDMPPETRMITLTIATPARAFELRDAARNVIWRAESPGADALTLTHETLPAGEYTLRADAAEYRFSLQKTN